MKENRVGTAQEQIDDIQQKVNGDNSDITKSLMDRVRGVRDELSDRILQQHKDTAHDHLNRGTQFLTEEYFPEERREPIYLPKQEGIMKHDDYQESIKRLLSYAEEYAGHEKMIAGLDSHAALTSDDGLETATSELRTVLERFANRQSTDIIFDAVNTLIDDANKDEELRESLSSYVCHSF